MVQLYIPPQGHCHFVCASSRPGRQWRKLQRAAKWTDSQPRCQVSTASSHHLQYANFVLQGKNAANKLRPQTGVCEPDVVAPKAPQNNPSYMYVRSADLPSDSLHQDLAWRAVIYVEDLKKPQNGQNWGVGACQGQYGILNLHTLMLLLIACTIFSDFSDQCHYH